MTMRLQCITMIGVAVAVVLLGGAHTAVAASSGEALYMQYCASCHGIDGTGNGPAAAAMTPKPPDLTAVSDRGRGRYSVADVMEAIDGRRAIAAHGSRAMPVWGEVFAEELSGQPHRERTTLLKVRELAEYVAELQKK